MKTNPQLNSNFGGKFLRQIEHSITKEAAKSFMATLEELQESVGYD